MTTTGVVHKQIITANSAQFLWLRGFRILEHAKTERIVQVVEIARHEIDASMKKPSDFTQVNSTES